MNKKEHVPRWIAWEVTRRCTLSCIHCRSSSEEWSTEGAFDTEQGLRLIDEIADFASPVLVLTGGDPLLREDVFELARHATSRELRVGLATNGLLVNAEVCRQIKDSGVRIVSLSLDGATAESHDDFRRQDGAFDATIRAAELFREHDIDFLVNSSFTKRNQDQIVDTYRLAKRLGARAWYLFMIVPTGRGEDTLAELIPPEDYDRILEWHYQVEKEEDDILMRPTCAPHYYRLARQLARDEGRRWEHGQLKFSPGTGKGCIAGQSICLIDAEGDVWPCSYFPVAAGNVLQTPFAEICEGSPLFADLRDFSRYKGRCGQCEYVKVCGGCRARAYAMDGDYLAEEPYCDHVPKRMRRRDEPGGEG
ncbi:MAG: radical SAM protein [Deltaproteobacteria bacterium]|nr:radical SAM protein [Deltaproteobacteria bacterium]